MASPQRRSAPDIEVMGVASEVQDDEEMQPNAISITAGGGDTPPPDSTLGVRCSVTRHCLAGAAGRAGCLLYTGQALRQTVLPTATTTESAMLNGPSFVLLPHGEGEMELLGERPIPVASSVPRRTASSVDDEARSSTETYVCVKFTGTFDQGARHGWGVLARMTSTTNPVAWITQTISCEWNRDVPQLLSGPCTMVESEERPGSHGPRIQSVYTGLAMAVQDTANTDGGFGGGLSWALATRFLPDALGERVDLEKGTRFCGEWQCGMRHGFGIITTTPNHYISYVGLFDNDARHGAGTSIDEPRKLTFDGVWADDGVAASGGTLHLPHPSPLAVQGQKWLDATTVGTGFLVKAKGAHTGMWEPLLSALDEELPSLLTTLEEIGNKLANPDAVSSPTQTPAASSRNLLTETGDADSIRLTPSPHATPMTGPSFAPSTVNMSFIQDPPAPLHAFRSIVATFLASTHATRNAMSRIRRELDSVKVTAHHALSLPATRRALTTFQRCMLFLYGSCAALPFTECGGGGNPASPGSSAISWCYLCRKAARGFTCPHRARGGRSITVDVFNRLIQAVSSIVLSLRLRLMACHGAAQIPMLNSFTTPPRAGRTDFMSPESDAADCGSPAVTTGTSHNAFCAHCAVNQWLVTISMGPKECDLASECPAPEVAAAVLSGAPLIASSSRLTNTTWDAVASTVMPLTLAVARAATAAQVGALALSLKRFGQAMSFYAMKNPTRTPCEIPVLAMLLDAEAHAWQCDVAAVAKVWNIAVALFPSSTWRADFSSTDPTPRLGYVLNTVAQEMSRALCDAIALGDSARVETTNAGPLFVFGQTTRSGREPSPGGQSARSTAADLLSKRFDVVCRCSFFARCVARELLPSVSNAYQLNRATRLVIQSIVTYGGPTFGAALIVWCQVLLRTATLPATVSRIPPNDSTPSTCNHDALSNIEAFTSDAGFLDAFSSAAPSSGPQGSVDIGTIPATNDTGCVVGFELSLFGGWSLYNLASTVSRLVDGVEAASPDGPDVPELKDVLNRFVRRHLSVSANVLAAGCASMEPTTEVPETPSLIPTAVEMFDDVRRLSRRVNAFVTVPPVNGTMVSADLGDDGDVDGMAGLEVDDHVLLRVTDWCFSTLMQYNTDPSSANGLGFARAFHHGEEYHHQGCIAVFPLRNVAKMQRADGSRAGGDESGDEAPPPAAAPGDTTGAADAARKQLIDTAMSRCYSGDEPQLRELRLEPLTQILRSLGVELQILNAEHRTPKSPLVVERMDSGDGSPGPYPTSSSATFTSPGVLNIDPRTALHLKLSIREPRAVHWPQRQGALRVSSVTLDHVVAHWRRLRRVLSVAQTNGMTQR